MKVIRILDIPQEITNNLMDMIENAAYSRKNSKRVSEQVMADCVTYFRSQCHEAFNLGIEQGKEIAKHESN